MGLSPDFVTEKTYSINNNYRSLCDKLSYLLITSTGNRMKQRKQEKADYTAAYPYEPGIVWPPRNLQDVKNNCKIWRDKGYYDPKAL